MSDRELDPAGELRQLAGDCVHCGFCLPACPTYQLWGEEMDSPRGRIHLITQILDGAEGTEAAATHLDRCLGCMACVPACPSGVRYDRLIEAAREWAEEPLASPPATSGTPASGPNAPGALVAGADGVAADAAPPVAPAGRERGAGPVLPPRSLRERAIRRAIFETFPYPRRLRLLLPSLRAVQRTRADRLVGRSELVARLAPELAAALRIAPARPAAGRSSRATTADEQAQSGGREAPSGGEAPVVRARRATRRPVPRLPELVPARGEKRATVGMLTGCVQRVFFPEVNTATARVLAMEGCDVIVPRSQGCCGALSLHGGRRAEAQDFARRTIETFERADVSAIVVNAAGCGSAMKEYELLLADDPEWAGRAEALSDKVRDISEFLAALGPAAHRHPLPVSVVYQDACHLGHAQRITRQPRELLAAIPELRLAEVGDGGTCCGSAGIYNLVQPQAAAQLGERKARAVHAAGAGLLVSANPGCAMQIAAALSDQGTPMPVAHTVQVLDASLRGLPASTLLT